jgi:hypothetical protein
VAKTYRFAFQVLVAMRFYAGGSFQEIVGDTIELHKSTVSRIIRQVSLAITARLDQFIHYPTDAAEIQKVREEFLVRCLITFE